MRASSRSAPMRPIRSRGVRTLASRGSITADIMAVEPGDRHIIGDLQPQTLALERRADREVIVGAENAVELWIFAARPAHQLNPRRIGRGLLHHHAVGRHPGVKHRLLVPLLFDDSTFIKTRPR